MASHTEIRVGDTDWVVRVGGEDARVKVLEKIQKPSGRGYEFRCKRVGGDGRVVGRNLTKGSGAFRRPGEAPKATGFSRTQRPPVRSQRTTPAPTPTPPPVLNPPASAFFSQVQEPGAVPSRYSPPPTNGRTSTSRLGSLRGRGKASASPSPARPVETPDAPTPVKARREIEKQLKHTGLSPLVTDLVKELVQCDGTEFAAQQIYGRVMANHRMRSYGMPPFGR